MHLIKLISYHRKEIHCAAEKCTSPYIQSSCRIQIRAAAIERQPREHIPENANPTEYFKKKIRITYSKLSNFIGSISLEDKIPRKQNTQVLFPTEKLKFILPFRESLF